MRGGMNNTDPAIAIPDDQAVLHQNTELVDAMLAERRLGTSAVTLPAFLSAHDKITFLHRHLPDGDPQNAELWALGLTGTTSVSLGYKTSSWQSEVTISDTPTKTSTFPYQWAGQTLHGKLFLAYRSNVDRLHVWDGTSVRRAGLAEPAAPTAADNGSGSLTGTRYYRQRYTEMSGTDVIRRSEPSDQVSITPSGSGSAVRVTKSAAISEGETHWELEASTDGVNFYRIAQTAVGTTTYDDSTAYATGYASGNVLSEDTGDYALIPSCKFLTADEDRLVWAGSYETGDYTSRVGWTPVYGADGDGNDERFETDTDPFFDLDTYDGGDITGLSAPVLGAIWVFKERAVYKLVRSGERDDAYDVVKYSDAIGAIEGSVVSGFTETGQPCVYFIDPTQGPHRAGPGGIIRCGDDVRATWSTINVDASSVIARALYYPAKRQVIWALSTDSDNTPTEGLVLHVDRQELTRDGMRKGWVFWTGDRCTALAMCLFASNIESGASRSYSLVPLIGVTTANDGIQLCDTGTDDSGTAYTATVTSKPYVMSTAIDHFEVASAALLAKVSASTSVTMSVSRDFGLETPQTVSNISLAASGSETDVIKYLDNLYGAEMRVGQFSVTDGASIGSWELNQLVLRNRAGQQG